jgi:hypothetical protein
MTYCGPLGSSGPPHPITWKFRHVLEHQDNHTLTTNLDRWALLNVEMDIRAKQHISIA